MPKIEQQLTKATRGQHPYLLTLSSRLSRLRSKPEGLLMLRSSSGLARLQEGSTLTCRKLAAVDAEIEQQEFRV